MKKIIIIGGGLAGLVTAVKLADAGIACTVIEKKSYPFHRVCGEYISNEAKPFLQAMGLFPDQHKPPQISSLQLSSIKGKHVMIPLDLGGFGISRFSFDHFLYQEALRRGVAFRLNTEVEQVNFSGNEFLLRINGENEHADVVIGTFGKRSRLDLAMKRKFTLKRSPFVGVKYHIRCDHPDDLIALHNFAGGYCGINNIEEGKTNLCYLTHRDQLKRFKNIPQFQREVLYENPFLKSIFTTAEFLFTTPETINEVTFETKSAVENHILMSGDAAGMITPLCGNGMAMAIHSAKILSERVTRYCQDEKFTRTMLEESYTVAWKQNFSARLWRGRQVQRLFGQHWASEFAVALAGSSRTVARQIVKSTHGHVF